MSRKGEFIIALLGLIVAVLALIPAFGQWLFPPEVAPTPSPTPTTASDRATPTPVPPTPEPSIPQPAAPTPSPDTPDDVAYLFDIAAQCDVTQSMYTDLPSSPLVAQYERDAQARAEVAFAKRFVVLAMEIAGDAVLQQDTRCLRELYAGVPLQELEGLAAGDPMTPLVYKSRFEWDFSRLLDLRMPSARRLEVDVCLFQGLDAYNLQGVLTMSYPAEYSAATMVLEQRGDLDRYYITALVELDPFIHCQ